MRKNKRDDMRGSEDLDRRLYNINRLKAKKRRKKRVIVLFTEIIILVALLGVAYFMLKMNRINFSTLDDDKLEIYKDTGDYTNVALFGLDSRDQELDGGVQSDTILIASINNKNHDVKLISVYRDTLMLQSNDRYEKANSAYNIGGPTEEIALLNRNLDLDIKAYMSVDFNALAKTIDLLGGIPMTLTAEEAFWCNGYIAETSKVVGQAPELLDEAGGDFNLTGVQAVSFARIRYTDGNDMKRAQRQRMVLEAVIKKAKSAKISTLNKIVDEVLPDVSTSLKPKDLLGIAANASKFNLVGQHGFPFQMATTENVLEHPGSYIVACGMSKNVAELHEFLFGKKDYQVSDRVKRINDDIIYMTGIDENTDHYDLTGIDDK